MCRPISLATTLIGSMNAGVKGITASGLGSMPNNKCSIVALPTTTASYVRSGDTPVS
jgi:hypothetical protein